MIFASQKSSTNLFIANKHLPTNLAHSFLRMVLATCTQVVIARRAECTARQYPYHTLLVTRERTCPRILSLRTVQKARRGNLLANRSPRRLTRLLAMTSYTAFAMTILNLPQVFCHCEPQRGEAISLQFPAEVL